MSGRHRIIFPFLLCVHASCWRRNHLQQKRLISQEEAAADTPGQRGWFWCNRGLNDKNNSLYDGQITSSKNIAIINWSVSFLFLAYLIWSSSLVHNVLNMGVKNSCRNQLQVKQFAESQWHSCSLKLRNEGCDHRHQPPHVNEFSLLYVESFGNRSHGVWVNTPKENISWTVSKTDFIYLFLLEKERANMPHISI